MKKAISLILVLVMCLVLLSMTATAAPGEDRESAMELKAGQSDTFTNAGVPEGACYKINLSAASEVVVTLSMPGAVTNEQVWIASIREIGGGNDTGIYGGPTGEPLAGRELSGSLRIGFLDNGRGGFTIILSKQGTLYLDKGVYIIYIAQTLTDGNSATIKIDSITPISNSGGWTRESAPTIDPAKATVKQTRCHKEWSQDEYYWKFTLDTDAAVSIKKTVKLVPSSDDRINAGSIIRLVDDEKNPHFGNDIYGVADGEEAYSLEIREKDAVLTKTITYTLPEGTYYAHLSNGASYPGTEYTLEFSMKGGAATGSINNFTPINTYESEQFTDVNENAWYGFNNQKVVGSAFRYGLMKGNSATTFNPTGNITIAEAITMAARVHSIYSIGKDEFVQGNPWYQVYVDYCVSNGIIKNNEFTNYSRAATRAEMAYIFANALPATEFMSQNTVNTLPDVNSETPYYDAIILLYEAGIVGGSDDKGTFNPSSNIIRAEAAAFISRIILPDMRMSGKVYG